MTTTQLMQRAGEVEHRREECRQAADAASNPFRGFASVMVDGKPIEVVLLGLCNKEGAHGYRLARGFNGLAGYAPASSITLLRS
jgi:hypothetical protein